MTNRRAAVAALAVLTLGTSLGTGLPAAAAARGGPAAKPLTGIWRLAVQVTRYSYSNRTRGAVRDPALRVGHRGFDDVQFRTSGARLNMRLLPAGRTGFVAADGLAGPGRRHPLHDRRGAWTDSFPWPAGLTNTSCRTPKVLLALQPRGARLTGTEVVPLSYNCHGADTWFVQYLHLHLSGRQVSAAGPGSPLIEPRPDRAFVLRHLNYPAAIVGNGRPHDLRAAWRGRPTFPLRLYESIRSCPPGFRCGDETTEVTLPEDPQTFVAALVCSGFVTSTERFRYRVTMTDADGRRSANRATESFACRP